MRKFILLVILCFMLNCSSQIEPIAYVNINNIEQWSEDDVDLLSRIQSYRLGLGLSVLEPSRDIHNIAIERLETMKLTGGISHDGIGAVFDKVISFGYTHPTEILAYGYSSNESTLNSWKNSESHNEAIVQGGKLYVGVHVTIYKGKRYCIVIFAKLK